MIIYYQLILCKDVGGVYGKENVLLFRMTVLAFVFVMYCMCVNHTTECIQYIRIKKILFWTWQLQDSSETMKQLVAEEDDAIIYCLNKSKEVVPLDAVKDCFKKKNSIVWAFEIQSWSVEDLKKNQERM